MLQKPEEGNRGWLIWKDDQLEAVIDWEEEVVAHGLRHRINYARLVQRRASSPRAAGADHEGYRYSVQLALEGVPLQKPKHSIGHDIIGADLGPSTIALVPRAAEASLAVFCEELAPDEKEICRLQRRMERQRRAANPENYDAKGRIKQQGKKKLHWKTSKGYEQTRRYKAEKERKLAAHRKSLHGRKAHEIVAIGHTVILEHSSYRAWQKQYGRSVGLRAPGMFVELLRRTWASYGRHPARSPHTASQTLTVLSRLRQMCQKAALRALASLPLWRPSVLCSGTSTPPDLTSTLSADHLIPSCAQAVIRLLKVRRRACRPHMHGSFNGRMRGSPCPKAWPFAVPV